MMENKTIRHPEQPLTLVLGATGTVGNLVVRRLLTAGFPVRAASRKAGQWDHPNLTWIQFDYEDPQTFAPAVQGISRLFMVVRPGDDNPQLTAIPLLEQARLAGVGHVVLLSALGAQLRPDFGLRKLELAIETLGFAYTHLRPNWFMQLFTDGPLYADIMTSDALHIPAADAAISYIDVEDIADVAFAVLTQSKHQNRAYDLTGPHPLSHEQIMTTLSEVAGRPLAYVPLSEEQARQGLAAAQFSPARIERLIGFYRLVRSGLCAPVSPDVAQILGRPGTCFHDMALRLRPLFTR